MCGWIFTRLCRSKDRVDSIRGTWYPGVSSSQTLSHIFSHTVSGVYRLWEPDTDVSLGNFNIPHSTPVISMLWCQKHNPYFVPRIESPAVSQRPSGCCSYVLGAKVFFLCCSDLCACWANARSSTSLSPSPTPVLPYDSVVNRTAVISWNVDLQSVQEEPAVLRDSVGALYRGFWLTCFDTYCQYKL